jgi:hypothetical protein
MPRNATWDDPADHLEIVVRDFAFARRSGDEIFPHQSRRSMGEFTAMIHGPSKIAPG